MTTVLALLLLVVAGLALVFRADTAELTGLETTDFAIALTALALMLFIVGSVFGNRQVRPRSRARDLVTWVLFGGLLASAFGYGDELANLGYRIAGELSPSAVNPLPTRAETVDNERAVRIRKRSDGHFVARVEANTTAITMLVDTGASTVVLKPADAQKIGLDIEKLKYTVPVQTANGTTYAAAIRIKTLAVGPIVVKEIDALVAKPGTLKDSLLGMTFLSRLRSYEFAGEYLTLRI
jgi:aspartyl protease family protein